MSTFVSNRSPTRTDRQAACLLPTRAAQQTDAIAGRITREAGKAQDSREAATQFGRLPTAVISSGILATMKASELKIYTAICAFSNRGWAASIGVEKLGKLAGLSERTVQRTTAKLAYRELIKVLPGGGRNRANTYIVVTAYPVTTADTVSAEKPRHHECHPLEKKPRHFDAQTPSSPNQNPDSLGVTRSEVQNGQQQQAAAPAAADADILDALTQAGIGEPKRTQLATLPGVTAGIVRAAAEHARAGGKGSGVTVLEIESRAAKAQATAPAHATATEHAQRQRNDRRAEDANARRSQSELRQWRDNLSQCDRLKLREIAICHASSFCQQRWRDLPPEQIEPMTLMAEMFKRGHEFVGSQPTDGTPAQRGGAPGPSRKCLDTPPGIVDNSLHGKQENHQ